ncbi:MAG: hypothetical protein HYW01_04065 [Deltaproteobacteria bacterium]|nr:hypothetical protein [Deltaproteobacteria bacterium]
MGRVDLIIIIVFITFISFLTPEIVTAQTTGGAEEGSETTSQGTNAPQAQPNTPVIDNTGIVYPRENLDNFGMSSLNKTTGLGGREEGSTLGRDAKRKSNLEVNKPREKKKGEEAAEETGQETDTGSSEIESDSESAPIGYTSPGRKDGLFTWKDENGVVHVTNDPGSVPAKYRDQIIKESEKAESEELSEP